MNKKLLLISFVFLLLLQLRVNAQDRTITGKVSSAEDGSPLPGVSIIVKGTNRGVNSMANGTFKINAPSNSDRCQWDEKNGRRYQVGQENGQACLLRTPEAKPLNGIGRQHRRKQ